MNAEREKSWMQREHWSPEDYAGLQGWLAEQADETFRKFHQKLIPGTGGLLGVRMPVLKQAARDIARGNYGEWLAFPPGSYEEKMLRGLVLGFVKAPEEERLGLIQAFLPLIDNWAVCDSCCAGLKAAQRHPELYWDFCLPRLHSESEFEARFAAVMLLDHFVTQTHVDRVLEQYQSVAHPGYYVKMAVAWGLSVCYIRFPDRTAPALTGAGLDLWTRDKALQKIVESYRITPEQRAWAKSMKSAKLPAPGKE